VKADRFAALYGPTGRSRLRAHEDPLTSLYAAAHVFSVSGLVSTMADYLRFCRMLANGGVLMACASLPTNHSLMASNHPPGGTDLATMPRAVETQRGGQGFGSAFAVLLDQTVAQVIGTPGRVFGVPRRPPGSARED
jgi:hypothetical protein